MLKLLMPVATALGLALFAALGPGQGVPLDDEPHALRPEALAACKGKSAGDSCEFDAPRGHVVGSCRKAQTGDLVCFHPHQHHEHDGGAP
jgi:hypothetical protein